MPTIQEFGFPIYEMTGWYGILAPPGTPPAIVQKLRDEVAKAVTPAERDQDAGIAGHGAARHPARGFAKYLGRELAFYKQIVKDANIKPE